MIKIIGIFIVFVAIISGIALVAEIIDEKNRRK